MKVSSFFSGAGGLDLGFEQAGFEVAWANEYDSTIWATYRKNFKKSALDPRSIVAVEPDDVASCEGIVGGPPCQSWSEAGAGRGINDSRGQLFYEYIRILEAKQPLFFLAENVSGILLPRHKEAFTSILETFQKIGYIVRYNLLNANDYGVPQDRKRVIIIGYKASLGKSFDFDKLQSQHYQLERPDLRSAIGDLPDPIPAAPGNKRNNVPLDFDNHEYATGGFSTIYMSRNRVRAWDEPSFTIQAGGRHAPIHPSAPKMQFIEQNVRRFVPGKEELYRRMSVRECARIQTFPDTHEFIYESVMDGYKMVGNAVPCEFARRIALQIREDLYVERGKAIIVPQPKVELPQLLPTMNR